MFCEYYQAVAHVPYTWFIHGCFRNEDNLVFERTVDGCPELLEFFVTKEQEEEFLSLMKYLSREGYILSYQKQENRLKLALIKNNVL